jgi:hypothetical protein
MVVGIKTDQALLLGRASMLVPEPVPEEQRGRVESVMSGLLPTPLLLVVVVGSRAAELLPTDRLSVVGPPLLMRPPGPTITVPCQSNRATVP